MKHFLAVALVLTILVCNCNNANAGILDGVTGALNSATEAVKNAFASITDTLQGLVDSLNEISSSASSELGGLLGNILAIVIVALKLAVGIVSETINDIVKIVSTSLGDLAEGNLNLTDAIAAITNIIITLSGALKALINLSLSLVAILEPVIGGALGTVGDALQQLSSNLDDLLNEVLETIIDFVEDLLG